MKCIPREDVGAELRGDHVMRDNHETKHDEKKQGQLAAVALNCESSRSALAVSLQPLTDHIIESYVGRYVPGGRTSSKIMTKLLTVASTALNDSLVTFRGSDFKIGTIYSGYLRMSLARVFESPSGDH